MKSSAKKIGKSAVKSLHRFPAIKSNGGKNILVESPVQAKYCLNLEFDESVSCYFFKPNTFVVQNDNENSFIPDFEVHYVEGDKRFFDVRTFKTIQSPAFQQRFAKIESKILDSGYSFKVLSEIELKDTPLISNYQKLYQYKKRPTLNMANLYECAAVVKDPVSLKILLSRLSNKVSLREVYTWLALGYLHFDIEIEHLTTSSKVKFHVN